MMELYIILAIYFGISLVLVVPQLWIWHGLLHKKKHRIKATFLIIFTCPFWPVTFSFSLVVCIIKKCCHTRSKRREETGDGHGRVERGVVAAPVLGRQHGDADMLQLERSRTYDSGGAAGAANQQQEQQVSRGERAITLVDVNDVRLQTIEAAASTSRADVSDVPQRRDAPDLYAAQAEGAVGFDNPAYSNDGFDDLGATAAPSQQQQQQDTAKDSSPAPAVDSVSVSSGSSGVLQDNPEALAEAANYFEYDVEHTSEFMDSFANSSDNYVVGEMLNEAVGEDVIAEYIAALEKEDGSQEGLASPGSPYVVTADVMAEMLRGVEKCYDCSICFQPIDVRLSRTSRYYEARGGGGADDVTVGDQNPCVTSCSHVYHYSCLKEWIIPKAECPLCRKPTRLEDCLVVAGKSA